MLSARLSPFRTSAPSRKSYRLLDGSRRPWLCPPPQRICRMRLACASWPDDDDASPKDPPHLRDSALESIELAFIALLRARQGSGRREAPNRRPKLLKSLPRIQRAGPLPRR